MNSPSSPPTVHISLQAKIRRGALLRTLTVQSVTVTEVVTETLKQHVHIVQQTLNLIYGVFQHILPLVKLIWILRPFPTEQSCT